MIDAEDFFSYKNYYRQVATRPFSTYIEVGCWKGASIIYLTQCLMPRIEQVSIYAVDCFDSITEDIDPIFNDTGDYWKEYDDNIAQYGFRDKITDIKDISWKAAEQFNDRTVDFVFLDANKSYDCVMKDLTAWYPKISGHGKLAGHDSHKPSVLHALKTFCLTIGGQYIQCNEDVWEIV